MREHNNVPSESRQVVHNITIKREHKTTRNYALCVCNWTCTRTGPSPQQSVGPLTTLCRTSWRRSTASFLLFPIIIRGELNAHYYNAWKSCGHATGKRECALMTAISTQYEYSYYKWNGSVALKETISHSSSFTTDSPTSYMPS
jgi:hypothetical protein